MSPDSFVTYLPGRSLLVVQDNVCRHGSRAIDTRAAVNQDRLRENHECSQYFLHFALGGALVIRQRKVPDLQAARPIEPQQPLRMQIETSSKVVPIKLPRLQKAYNGADSSLFDSCHPFFHKLLRLRWQRIVVTEFRVVPKRSLRTCKNTWHWPSDKLRNVATSDLRAYADEIISDARFNCLSPVNLRFALHCCLLCLCPALSIFE
jgi:hypothetical protein